MTGSATTVSTKAQKQNHLLLYFQCKLNICAQTLIESSVPHNFTSFNFENEKIRLVHFFSVLNAARAV